jgi:tRNA 5-methylaminomethyl-2-thiouridine biosynthesis bifunctional protein
MQDTDPGLYFGDDGAPRSRRFGDIYYSLQDGLNESRAVFLRGCHLPEQWAGTRHFTVLELGFGTGLNIAALMQIWAESRPSGGHLHVFSIEGFLMPAEDAGSALGTWPDVSPFADALLAQWPKGRRGFHYMDFPQWGVSVTLALMDAEAALAAWQGRADAVFLDGFSPACNPDMWSEAVFAGIAAHVRPGTRLATFTVAGAVRRGLAEVGFVVEKCPGFGRKRERLEAVFQPDSAPPAVTAPPASPLPKSIAVIGAGIAGCALAYEIRQLGGHVDLLDPAPGSGASGNAAALVMPRLDAGDNAISALFADAFAYARDLYGRLCPEAVLGTGVDLCVGDARDGDRFARIQAQAGFAAGDLSLFALGEAADVPRASGLSVQTALWVEPQAVLKALGRGAAADVARITGWLRDADGQYNLATETGVRGGYDAVVIACGAGIFDFDNLAENHALRPVRGQVESVQSAHAPRRALSWGGYAIPLAGGLLFGATHDRDDRGSDIRAADQVRNLENLAKILPELAQSLVEQPFQSRASVRVTTRDYLPVAGEIAPGLFVLTGLGARGFCLAPLLARAVAAEMFGAPPPLPRVAKSLLRPGRVPAT